MIYFARQKDAEAEEPFLHLLVLVHRLVDSRLYFSPEYGALVMWELLLITMKKEMHSHLFYLHQIMPYMHISSMNKTRIFVVISEALKGYQDSNGKLS